MRLKNGEKLTNIELMQSMDFEEIRSGALATNRVNLDVFKFNV